MSPVLSYGRHRGPYRATSRHAAVLVAMFLDQNQRWQIPLTRRPSSLRHHGGQICLPGGQLDPGENALAAGIREFTEELGVRPVNLRHCGELDTQYVFNSNNRVHPVVAVIARPEQPWQPDPAEVDEIILLPVDRLLDPTHRRETIKQRRVRSGGDEVGQYKFRASTIEWDQHQVWGATAVILDQFAQLVAQTDALAL